MMDRMDLEEIDELQKPGLSWWRMDRGRCCVEWIGAHIACCTSSAERVHERGCNFVC